MSTRTAYSTTRPIPTEGKHIAYDGNGGYEGYFDGQLKVCGQYRSRVESELDQYVSDLLRDDLVATADEQAAAVTYTEEQIGVLPDGSAIMGQRQWGEPQIVQADWLGFSFFVAPDDFSWGDTIPQGHIDDSEALTRTQWARFRELAASDVPGYLMRVAAAWEQGQPIPAYTGPA